MRCKMDQEQLLENIGLIREKAHNNKLVIFVGSGVSRNTKGMSSWYEIIDKMAIAVKYSRCSYCSHKKKNCKNKCDFIKDYSPDEYLKIPQYLFNKNKRKYWEILNESIVEPVNAPLCSAIFEINPVHIITTNYDKLLEASSHVYRNQYDVIIEEKDLLNADKCKYIVKMHGDLDYPQTVVLKEQDYLDYSQNHILIELFIKSLLTNHIFLFLGYSLNDYNIKLIISWLNYMRSENNAFDKNHRVGYIVFDQPLNNLQISYFEKNNIGVIIIKDIPLVSDIPDSISADIGKRLFSFLNIIANPSLDVLVSANVSLNNTISLLKKYSFINYKSLLKILHISSYEFTDGRLKLYNVLDYSRIENYLKADDTNANELHRLFVNAGIEVIVDASHHDWLSSETIQCGDFKNSDLFNDELYNLYLENNYDKLNLLLEKKQDNIIKNSFYYSIINGYKYAFSEYKKIELTSFDDAQRIAFLHNLACLDTLKTFIFNPDKIIRYIENITNENEKEIYSPYIDLYNGNTHNRLVEEESYSKIKSYDDKNTIYIGGKGVYDLNTIRKIALNEYCFFFYNYIFYNEFSNLYSILKPYISALLYLNNTANSNYQQHSITNLDLDIITKFISTKDLYKIMSDYNIKHINIAKEESDHLVECFCNLSRSMLESNIYGYKLSFINHISNTAIILSRIKLNDDSLFRISESINKLFSSKQFDDYFFNIVYADFNQCLVAFSELIHILPIVPVFDIVKNILSVDEFYDYAVNVNFSKLRIIIRAFISDDSSVQKKIQEIIDSEKEFYKKIIILRLLYKNIVNEDLKKVCINFLSINYNDIPRNAQYDFIFGEWIKPTENDLEVLFSKIVDMQKERENQESNGMRIMPNTIDEKLEQVYVLYISGIIKDISSLEEISDKKSHLKFLLHPESFDYTKVDFSDYMWLNFARRKKYMDMFISHKSEILPRLLERYKSGSATDDEKKIMFRYMISDEDFWML